MQKKIIHLGSCTSLQRRDLVLIIAEKPRGWRRGGGTGGQGNGELERRGGGERYTYTYIDR